MKKPKFRGIFRRTPEAAIRVGKKGLLSRRQSAGQAGNIVVWVLVGVVVLVLLASVAGSTCCGKGGGKGESGHKSSTQAVETPRNTERVLDITVQGNDYLLNRKKVGLDVILNKIRQLRVRTVVVRCGKGARTNPFDRLEAALKRQFPSVEYRERDCQQGAESRPGQ